MGKGTWTVRGKVSCLRETAGEKKWDLLGGKGVQGQELPGEGYRPRHGGYCGIRTAGLAVICGMAFMGAPIRANVLGTTPLERSSRVGPPRFRLLQHAVEAAGRATHDVVADFPGFGCIVGG